MSWQIDVYETRARREVMLHDEHYQRTLEVDSDGDLLVEHEVDSDNYGGGTRTVRAYFPMPQVIEFLRACGYEVREPGDARKETDRG